MSVRTIAVGVFAALLVASMWFAIDNNVHDSFRMGRLHMIATCVAVALFGASWLLDGDRRTKWDSQSVRGRKRGKS